MMIEDETTTTPVTKISSTTTTTTTTTAGTTNNKKRETEKNNASKTSTTTSTKQHHHVGVADYFAVLGVGHELIYKHAQQAPEGDDNNVEDDAMLLERFYREIVDCAIFVAEENSDTNQHGGSNAQYHHLQYYHQNPTATTPTLMTPATMVYNNKNHPYAVTLGSPTPSDVTSGAGTQAETEAMEGWTIVQQTRPMGGSPALPISSSNNHNNNTFQHYRQPNNSNAGLNVQTWDANLDPISGLTAEIQLYFSQLTKEKAGSSSSSSTPLKDLRRKVQSTFQQRSSMHLFTRTPKTKYYLSYRRRSPDESHRPAIADMDLIYVQLHRATIIPSPPRPALNSRDSDRQSSTTAASSSVVSSHHTAAVKILRAAEAGKQAVQNRVLRTTQSWNTATTTTVTTATSTTPHNNNNILSSSSMDFSDFPEVSLETLIDLPVGYDEWSIPEQYQRLRFPSFPSGGTPSSKTVLFSGGEEGDDTTPTIVSSSSGGGGGVGGEIGVEAVDKPPCPSQETWQQQISPKLLQKLPDHHHHHHHSNSNKKSSMSLMVEDDDYVFIPILAIRRQRIGNEERYNEDPAIAEVAVMFCDSEGVPIIPAEELDDDDEEEDDMAPSLLLDKTTWEVVGGGGALQDKSSSTATMTGTIKRQPKRTLGTACLFVRKNRPLGFCDAAFSTSVMDRFPFKNYKGLPLPEEELPMFCYPTGCRLQRAKFCEAPLPQYYGFVVKNERGDSIYVSCVSFMEPLTILKQEQLARLSKRRRRVSLPHARFWAKRRRRQQQQQTSDDDLNRSGFDMSFDLGEDDEGKEEEEEGINDYLFTGFEDTVTFENKTICLVSRYPYWTAFRRFLSHLHSVSESSSDVPLERYISHLLLTVPIPKPGGPRILIPLPSFSAPLALASPPLKDLPLVDLPYERLVSCLDVPTIVTIVLGFLALERKVIVMSTRPSLVLDVCELLRSLIFPFDLCAPYVPRLTEPFMSCLDFPGAIFVGIHDDGSPDGLAAVVRKSMPEDSTIVDLDSGSIDCSGDRNTVLNISWGVVPPGPRSVLVSEIETLCRDASIEPGQEPLDSQLDSAFVSEVPANMVQDSIPYNNPKREPVDDRGIRDAFLRFFCSVLGGYERFLVVPDVDFLISGNEWFDAKGFLASASEEKAAFLGALVSTQLFQEFVQRRTEASDVHCMLFDECLAEFHSTPIPYFGRLGGDVETVQGGDGEAPYPIYSLLVDQCATISHQSAGVNGSFDTDSRHESETDSTAQHSHKVSLVSETTERMATSTDFTTTASGDWVTFPSRRGLPDEAQYLYCIDGNPVFPDKLDPNFYLPRQPESWLVEMSTAPTPMLTRSDKEVEEAVRRRKLATTYRGLQTQRRCLWQLPKLMGSHFLGTWLLCIPAQVAQPNLSHEQQSKYLLRALGALRLLRSKQRIVPDEAAYRALIVACGRTRTDRRMELVKLFGLLRSDGIFPSAVTLGQYTKALAEGYSKQSTGALEEEGAGGVEVTESASRDLRIYSTKGDPEVALSSLDGSLALLEDAGRRWRQKNGAEKEAPNTISDDPSVSQESKPAQSDRQKKRSSHRPWLPVLSSTSFVPSGQDSASSGFEGLSREKIRLQTVWSRTKSCDSCGYIPLEEEIQAGWDVLGGEHEIPGAISCPRCGELLIPMLGYRTYSIEDALALADEVSNPAILGECPADFASLPPQMGPSIEETDAAYITYISPASLRFALERLVDEHGESILERETLKEMDPELFYNLWWYCARFSLPLPLPISSSDEEADDRSEQNHCVGIIAWDHRVALRGCYGCARVLSELIDKDGSRSSVNSHDTPESIEYFGDYPLLSRFNLQGYYSTVWDHEDMSEILVTLVEACDKRDFKPVIECVLRRNKKRRARFAALMQSNASSNSDAGESSSCCLSAVRADYDPSAVPIPGVELDCYRTILYLAKYQCTSAFHAFFPATLKPCKGYHFWCPVAPLPIFDRLLREAVKRTRVKSNTFAPLHDVSEVALGFRSVFGHLV